MRLEPKRCGTDEAKEVMSYFLSSTGVEIVGSDISRTLDLFEEFLKKIGHSPISRKAIGRAICQSQGVTGGRIWDGEKVVKIYMERPVENHVETVEK